MKPVNKLKNKLKQLKYVRINGEQIRFKYVRAEQRVKYHLGLTEHKDYFSCLGLSSEVYDDNGDSLGHICIVDAEDTDYKSLKEEMKQHFDVFFILMSSKGSYHVINPVVRSLEETKAVLDSIDSEDSQHTEIGYKRGDWVCRVTEKRTKPSPVLLEEIVRPSDHHKYSKPHLYFLSNYYGCTEPESMIELLRTIGKTNKIIKYYTFK